MGRLDDFLALPDVDGMTEEIYINERLGTFTVKPMTERQLYNYRNRCKIIKGKSGENFDSGKFNLLIISGQVIEPNFSDAAFLTKANCNTASEFISKKFFAGEVAEIAEKITEISGFGSDINEEVEEAKNS